MQGRKQILGISCAKNPFRTPTWNAQFLLSYGMSILSKLKRCHFTFSWWKENSQELSVECSGGQVVIQRSLRGFSGFYISRLAWQQGPRKSAFLLNFLIKIPIQKTLFALKQILLFFISKLSPNYQNNLSLTWPKAYHEGLKNCKTLLSSKKKKSLLFLFCLYFARTKAAAKKAALL